MNLRRNVSSALIVACGFVAGCAHAPRAQQSSEVVLEIFNPQTTAMSVSYTAGRNADAVTELGTIAANDTRRWAIPGRDIALHLAARDATGGKLVRKDLNLGKGPVVRWEIRE